jgi:hypothetical protein
MRRQYDSIDCTISLFRCVWTVPFSIEMNQKVDNFHKTAALAILLSASREFGGI